MITFLRDGEIWGVPVDVRTLRPLGAPRLIVGAARDGGGAAAYTVSRNGVLVVRRGAASQSRALVIVNRAGKETSVVPLRGAFRSPRFSRDGQRIAYTMAGTASGGGDLWVVDIRDGRPLRLTSDTAHLAPEWGADPRTILLARLRTRNSGTATVEQLSATGGSESKVLLQRPNQIYEVQITPDGRRILWREDAPATHRDILIATLDSPQVIRPLRATPEDERGLALSPDGKWYLYTTGETGASVVYLSRVDGDGTRIPVSEGGGTEPRWAANGEIFYRRLGAIYATRPVLGDIPRIPPPQRLFADDFYFIGFEPVWDVSPDGQRFVMIREERANTGSLELWVNWVAKWKGGAP